MRYDCIIIGGGPAGLTAASVLARNGNTVCVLDKNERVGVKLLLAGGGKGNITNRLVECSDYVGSSPGFAEYALSRVTPEMVTENLRAAGVPLEERSHGRIFCAVSAKAVLQKLLEAAPARFCRVEAKKTVTRIDSENGMFTVFCQDSRYAAPRLILATGSPAWPSCGADDSGLRLAKSLGHTVVPPKPVLVPLVMPEAWPLAGLAGVSCEAAVTCGPPDAPVYRDSLLFTHKGISGPAALQVSCHWRKGVPVRIDFLPGRSVKALLDAATGKATPRSALSPLLPERLLAALLPEETAKRRIAELSRQQRDAVDVALHRHTAVPLRTEGFARAEAASGGVAVRDVDAFTMQSLRVPGLFFCGEMLDVTGRLGGYNLHWAFASGTVAGEGALAR